VASSDAVRFGHRNFIIVRGGHPALPQKETKSDDPAHLVPRSALLLSVEIQKDSAPRVRLASPIGERYENRTSGRRSDRQPQGRN
jgi:hypothetical protein